MRSRRRSSPRDFSSKQSGPLSLTFDAVEHQEDATSQAKARMSRGNCFLNTSMNMPERITHKVNDIKAAFSGSRHNVFQALQRHVQERPPVQYQRSYSAQLSKPLPFKGRGSQEGLGESASRGPNAMQDADFIVRLQRSRSAAQNFSRGVNPMPGHEVLRTSVQFKRSAAIPRLESDVPLPLAFPSPSPASSRQPSCPVVHAISARTRKANKTHLRAGPKR